MGDSLMHSTVRALFFCVALALCAGLTAGSAPARLKSRTAVTPKKAKKVTLITVAAGKPSELAFKLSKLSSIPKGKVTFKVTNLGVAYHDFKICARPVASASAAKNAC